MRSGLRIPVVTATVAATSNQEDQIGVSAKEMYARASLVCPSATVQVIRFGGFKPASHRKQSKSRVPGA